MLEEYSVEDLTRAFFRQFLIQNRFGKTYQAFQNEDVRSKLKIPKAVLIKCLCMQHLIGTNKKLEKPYKSLAQILIYYLKNKSVSRLKENQNQRIQPQRDMGGTPSVEQIKTSNGALKVETPQIVKTSDGSTKLLDSVSETHKNNQNIQESQEKEEHSTFEGAKQEVVHKAYEAHTVKTTASPPSAITEAPPAVQSTYEQALPSRVNGMRRINKKQSKNPPTNAPEPPKEQPLKRIVSTQVPQVAEHGTVLSKALSSDNPVDQSKRVMMFGKKRQQEPHQEEKKDHPMFKNSIQQPVKVQYEYEKMNFNKFEPKRQLQVDLSYKKPQVSMKGKKKQKPINYDMSSRLRKILFQGQCKGLPKAWCQGLLLSQNQSTYYGLEQLEGGPCGIVAALQCYFLKHIFYLCLGKNMTQQMRENCLIAAMCSMLLKMNPSKIVLALPAVATVYAQEAISVQNLEILTINFKNPQHLYEQIYEFKTSFFGRTNHGYTLLLYSCILTKGIEEIELEMDSKQAPLIGNHGHCNQQLVNLFLTGKASTNCFDNIKVFGEGTDKVVLKGIEGQQEFGFLTIFQSLGYIEVGRNLKNPSLPIWVICKQFHYHVIFANHYLISEDSKIPKLDIVYFDGLYNCKDRIVLTLSPWKQDKPPKLKDLPMIEQVLLTKWGPRSVDWNGSIPIL